ncbi:acyltransferase Pun1-like [Actinidia eriantha]|uniref:acyltransferase Pun1-like n=1 Tax=Actinidia eriantha TaxID=165200 RepID=UPI00259021D3|nr:acyltransferase Pun1-like [Actinidia eriantha]
MQVQIISRQIIKPSSPTPPHLRTHDLSLFDKVSGRFYVARLFFYLQEGFDTASKTADVSNFLKKSLSETLTRYYPFAGSRGGATCMLMESPPLAGRLKHGVCIDCNDEGVEFLEAEFLDPLSVLLLKPHCDALHQLYPKNLHGNSSYKGSLVVIQINYFQCGGMAISVCVSHKIADGCTLINFIGDWAATARQEGEKVRPMFITETSSTSLLDCPLTLPEIELKKQSCVTRRFVFDASKIADLKAMAAGSGVQNPCRVEVVTALRYKCAVKNVCARNSCTKNTKGKAAMLIQTMNMHPRMVPPLPDNSVGNFTWQFTLSFRDQRERNLVELVAEMRKSRSEFYNKYEKRLKMTEWFGIIRELMKEAKENYAGNTDLLVFISSSMCRFPFYEVDFGWGKPVWVALAGNVFKNTFVVMDRRSGDGIESWVALDEQDMALFENDDELLGFALMYWKLTANA